MSTQCQDGVRTERQEISATERLVVLGSNILFPGLGSFGFGVVRN